MLTKLPHIDVGWRVTLQAVVCLFVCLFVCQVIVHRHEVEQDLTNQLARTESERQSLVDKLSANQRQLSSLQLEKHDLEKSAVRLEKDKKALMKTLGKVLVGYAGTFDKFLAGENLQILTCHLLT